MTQTLRQLAAALLVPLVALVPVPVLAQAPDAGGEGAAPSTPRASSEGVARYLAGDYRGALEALAAEQSADPASTTVALYQGLSYLALDDLDGATEAWSRLLGLEPDHPQAQDLRRHLTLLRQRAAERAAKGLDETRPEPLDPSRIAVLRFSGSGHAEAPVLAKGLAAMVLSDLSRVPGLVVVDRVRADAIRAELGLREAGLTDAQAAPRVGKLVSAGRVASGRLDGGAPEADSSLSATLSDVETGVDLGSAETAGPTAEFFRLEKELVFALLAGLGRPLESLPPDLRAELEPYHTTSFVAFSYFSQGMVALDEQRFDEAGERFRQAIEEDEDFDLAREKLALVPLAALSTTTIAAAVEAGALNAGIGVVAPATAAGAAAAGSSAGSAAAAAAAAGAAPAGIAAAIGAGTLLGVTTTTLLIGAGAAAVAGGVVAGVVIANDNSGGGGGGGGEEPSNNVRVEIPAP